MRDFHFRVEWSGIHFLITLRARTLAEAMSRSSEIGQGLHIMLTLIE